MKLRWRVVMMVATFVGAFGAFGAFGVGVVVHDTATGNGTRPVVSSSPEVSEDQLQADYDMTRYMANPDATGPMFTYGATDPQLQHASDPAFVRALEDHTAVMDRMLGRGRP